MFGSETKREYPPMLDLFPVRALLSVLSAVFGGFGVFCAINTLWGLDLSTYAIVSLGTAFTISYFCDA